MCFTYPFPKGERTLKSALKLVCKLDTMGRSGQRRREQIKGRGKRIKCLANFYIIQSISNLT